MSRPPNRGGNGRAGRRPARSRGTRHVGTPPANTGGGCLLALLLIPTVLLARLTAALWHLL